MTVLLMRRMGHPLLAGALLLFILGAVGCGGSKGNLSGKVSYQGKPLAVGSVIFIGVDAKPRTAPIEEDGSYHFTDLPVGEAKLAVYSPDPAKQVELKTARATRRKKPTSKDKPVAPATSAADRSAAERTKWFAIPDEYSDVDHSGLRVTIHAGPNTYPIDMK